MALTRCVSRTTSLVCTTLNLVCRDRMTSLATRHWQTVRVAKWKGLASRCAASAPPSWRQRARQRSTSARCAGSCSRRGGFWRDTDSCTRPTRSSATSATSGSRARTTSTTMSPSTTHPLCSPRPPPPRRRDAASRTILMCMYNQSQKLSGFQTSVKVCTASLVVCLILVLKLVCFRYFVLIQPSFLRQVVKLRVTVFVFYWTAWKSSECSCCADLIFLLLSLLK